jgi:peptide/nickel transport system substrate-binding protein
LCPSFVAGNDKWPRVTIENHARNRADCRQRNRLGVGTVDFPHSGCSILEEQGELMKVTRFTKGAVAITAAFGLVVGVIAPANATTRTTLVLVESNALTSLNANTPDTNLTINADIAYVTGMGFNYYDNHSTLKRNTILGSYKIIKNTAKDLRVMYTINKGKLWSDGAPITGVDLLLSHVISSGAYSKKAGLGDPTNAKTVPAFNSGGYGGVYDTHVVGLPVLSKDQMSVTVRYDSFQPDWQISGPAPSPVHALEELAAGKTKLGTAKENLAATAKFLKDLWARCGVILTTSRRSTQIPIRCYLLETGRTS